MKKPVVGEKKQNLNKLFLFSAIGYLLIVALLLAVTFPDLLSLHRLINIDKTVSVAVDWEELNLLARREKKPVEKLFETMRLVPVDYLAVPFNLVLAEENKIREKGFKLLWKTNEIETSPLLTLLSRFQSGDGALPLNDSVLGYPGLLKEVASTIDNIPGILPVVEFGPSKGLFSLMELTRGHWVKTHELHLEEVLDPKFNLWKPRLVRAVRERGMRLLIVHLSPSSSFSEDLNFLESVRGDLQKSGYLLGSVSPIEFGGTQVTFRKFRMPLLLVLSIFGPLAVLVLIRENFRLTPFLLFLEANFMSLVIGLCLYSLASTPETFFGLNPVRGVKLFLVLPLIAAFWILLNREEKIRFLNLNVKIKHLIGGSMVIALLGGLYLMRSGNFPIFSISETERILRDGLESFLGARPRFKEYMVGQPLLMVGLILQRSKLGKPDFIQDGRIFLLAGLIGQISILNTFMHVHTPIVYGILRTVHGLWMGLILSVPFYAVIHSLLKKKDSRT